MKQKSFKITVQKKHVTVEESEKVVAFGQRLSDAMKIARRDFQKKAKASAERASKLVLNA